MNYFFQNDSLRSANQNLEDQKFSTFDAAGTFGGPIIQDKAWFFRELSPLGARRRCRRNRHQRSSSVP